MMLSTSSSMKLNLVQFMETAMMPMMLQLHLEDLRILESGESLVKEVYNNILKVRQLSSEKVWNESKDKHLAIDQMIKCMKTSLLWIT